MTEKHDLKWALELAIELLEIRSFQMTGVYLSPNINNIARDYRLAADMLKNGGPVVEKKSKAKCYKCECGKLYKRQSYCPECKMSAYPHSNTITARKRWTEREKIQIVHEKSKPTFEEIDDGYPKTTRQD